MRTVAAILFLVCAAPSRAQEPAPPSAPAAPAPDRSSPRRSVRGFLEACQAGDYARAAAYLDVTENAEDCAQDLFAALQLGLPRAAQLAPEKAAGDRLVLGQIQLLSGPRPIEMARDPEEGWRFTSETAVGAADMLAQLGVPWIGDFLPLCFFTVKLLTVSLWQWLGLLVILIGGFVAATILQWLLMALGRTLFGKTRTQWDDEFLKTLPGPLRLSLLLLAIYAFSPLLKFPAASQAVISLLVRTLLVAAGTWFVLRLVQFASRVVEAALVRDVTDEGRIRSIRTQVNVPARIIRVAVLVIGAALILMQFEVVRSVGVSLMASAGLAGIVIGFAAQRTIGNVFSGVQLAITQPIRIGDVVIVENEWGWIEEIGLTYVVVKVWDLRRLVLPVGYFLDRPFQNWTKAAPDILGTIFVYTDYTVPVDDIRAELKRVLENEGRSLWDGKVQGVQVTELKERTVEVRLLVSAKDSPTAWDLRCLVREKILTWLQSRGKGHLPLHRVEMVPPGAAPAPSPTS